MPLSTVRVWLEQKSKKSDDQLSPQLAPVKTGHTSRLDGVTVGATLGLTGYWNVVTSSFERTSPTPLVAPSLGNRRKKSSLPCKALLSERRMRVALHNMRQDRNEPVRAFGAHLCGQAGVCKFMVKCTSCDAELAVMQR